MPIQITITVETAAEAVQLVQDLASTMSGMNPSDIPAKTEVSTVEQPVPVAPAPAVPVQPAAPTPTAQAPAVPPVTTTSAPTAQPVPTTAPTTPSVAPVAQTVAPPVAPQAPAAPATPTVPTSAPQYDFNQLATATMQLQQAGQNIFEIFSRFGIQALNQLPKERYAEYAAVLRERGAKI